MFLTLRNTSVMCFFIFILLAYLLNDRTKSLFYCYYFQTLFDMYSNLFEISFGMRSIGVKNQKSILYYPQLLRNRASETKYSDSFL